MFVGIGKHADVISLSREIGGYNESCALYGFN